MIGSQIPADTIFVDAEPVLHPQMPAQHSGAKPALQAHHIFRAHRLPDRHRRLAQRRRWRGGLPETGERSMHLDDQSYQLVGSDLMMPYITADDTRDPIKIDRGRGNLFGH
jgi:hypothetical protein